MDVSPQHRSFTPRPGASACRPYRSCIDCRRPHRLAAARASISSVTIRRGVQGIGAHVQPSFHASSGSSPAADAKASKDLATSRWLRVVEPSDDAGKFSTAASSDRLHHVPAGRTGTQNHLAAALGRGFAGDNPLCARRSQSPVAVDGLTASASARALTFSRPCWQKSTRARY